MKNFAFGFGLALATLAAPSLVRADMLHWGIYNPNVVVYDNGTTVASTQLAKLDPKAIGAQIIVFDADDKDVDIASRTVKAYLDNSYIDSSGAFVTDEGCLAGVDESGWAPDYWTELGNYGSEAQRDQWMFAIAIFGEEGQIIALTEAVNYSDIAEYVSDRFGDAHLKTEWGGSGYVIPEPSGTLLTLLGFAVLGLKRKQEVA